LDKKKKLAVMSVIYRWVYPAVSTCYIGMATFDANCNEHSFHRLMRAMADERCCDRGSISIPVYEKSSSIVVESGQQDKLLSPAHIAAFINMGVDLVARAEIFRHLNG